MTGYMLASLIFLGGIGAAVVGELLNEEIRGWLDRLPHFILRLAARRLDSAGKIAIYEDEWLPELTSILRGAEARPISRLIIGIKFSVGLLITAERIARHLHRTPPDPAQPGHSSVAIASAVEVPAELLLRLLREKVEETVMRSAFISEDISHITEALFRAEYFAAEVAASGSEATIGARQEAERCRVVLAAQSQELAAIERELRSLVELRDRQAQLLGNG